MKKVFITGGSGTVGYNFIKKYYDKYKFYSYCRNEKMQVALKRRFPDVEIILGSIEDESFLIREVARTSPDIILHAAAIKHVDTAERQPQQTININIVGSANVIKSSIAADVPLTIGISTDKACMPDCIYGYTKLLMEKIFLAADNKKNKFVCCRFGNVAGSHGSVIPHWLSLKSEQRPLQLTHPDMTRLMFSSNDAAELIQKCIDESEATGGFIISKKMKQIKMKDLAYTISDSIEVVGIRPGEKLSEDLISEKEVKFTYVEGEYIFIRKEENNNMQTRLKKRLDSAHAAKMSLVEMRNLVDIVKKELAQTFLIGKQY